MATLSPSTVGESSKSGSNASPMDPSFGSGGGGGMGMEAKRSMSMGTGDAVDSDESRKKQKFSRSRTACLQCRSRKSKCGALPPNPCPNCIEADLPCQWPTEDGRSSKARLQRSRSAHLAGLTRSSSHLPDRNAVGGVGGTGGLGAIGSVGSVGIADSGSGSGHQAGSHSHHQPRIPQSSALADSGWLDRLLLNGSSHTANTNANITFAQPQFPPYANITPSSAGSMAPFPFAQPTSSSQTLGFGLSPGSLSLFNSSPTHGAAGPASSGPSHLPPPQSLSSLGGHIPASAVDPAQFVWAASSRLPLVEESSPNDERSSVSGSGPSPANGDPGTHGSGSRPGQGQGQGQVRGPQRQRRIKEEKDGNQGKIVKITWWRPHGQTAIAPGLKRITLKVRVDTPQDTWQMGSSPQVTIPTGPDDTPQELIAPDGLPSAPVMRHLLDVFMVHFGCQFPFIDKRELEAKIEARTASVFLLNSIAAIAARFSTHPVIALPSLKPYEYGNVFYNRAKLLLGSMLAVPSRETVAAFVLLAHMGFANDSESEVWMMMGLAVRMSIDAGLHVNPPEESSISAEDRRLNRLVFWSVLLMDYALSFGVGRQTTFRPEDITQTVPTEEEIRGPSVSSAVKTEPELPRSTGALSGLEGDKPPRSPFPFAAKMMASYAPLINLLNRSHDDPIKSERELLAARGAAIREYNRLPTDMQWNVSNLQRHSRANQGAIFLHLHLWMHTILASGYLTGSHLLRRNPRDTRHGTMGSTLAPGSTTHAGLGHTGFASGTATPNSSTASNIWRNSVRTIGDVLVLADIINPYAYFALPFVNQAWFVAGSCYVKEIEQHAFGGSPPNSSLNSPRGSSAEISEGSDASVFEDEDEEDDDVQGEMRQASREGKGQGGGESGNGAKGGRDVIDLGHAGRGHEASSGGGGAAAEITSRPVHSKEKDPRQVDLSRALLTSVATTNISTLQQGLSKLSTYWIGAEWIAAALGQRIAGIHDVDLVDVSEKLGSFVSLPDAGLVGRATGEAGGWMGALGGVGGGVGGLGQGMGGGRVGDGVEVGNGQVQEVSGLEGDFDFGDLDFSSLPFDLLNAGDGSNVIEQDVPIPQTIQPEWFR